MLKHEIISGKNKDEIIKEYLEQNNLKEDDIYINESIVTGKLFTSKKYELEIIKKDAIKTFIKEYFNTLGKLMNISIKVEIRVADDIYNILLIADNSSIIIGKEGKNLEAIQTLLRQTISAQVKNKLKINVDASGYKAKKNKHLEHEIRKIASEIEKTKLDVKLDPMNSFERRIVHNVISEYQNLSTTSVGEAPNRYVIIKYED